MLAPFRKLMAAMALMALVMSHRSVAQTATAPAGALPLLDLREPMALAANAIVARLDATQNYRPFFLIRGKDGVPHSPAHAEWDFGDMTGRYLEGLIMARQMGITSPEMSLAEERLGRYLLSMLGNDGLVHHPDNGPVDHVFSQGSALYGLVAWYEDSGDPKPRDAAARLIRGLLKLAEKHGDHLTFPSVKLEQSSGSHIAGYGIWPIIRFHVLTGDPAALELAEGMTRWVIDDDTVAEDGTITKPLSWEGHIHSWFDAYAGCLRTARISRELDHKRVVNKAQALYDWVRRTNSTDFGWFATFPTHTSCETCAISSAIRLALELANSGAMKYMSDVGRFAVNQAVEAQFRDLPALSRGDVKATPLLLGVFDSQSMPNSLLGSRGGEDVGNVEGCCLNGGMRAIYLAWRNGIGANGHTILVHQLITRESPWLQVVNHEPHEGRVDVRLHQNASFLGIRIPAWVPSGKLSVEIDGKQTAEFLPPDDSPGSMNGPYVGLLNVKPGQMVTLRFPLRQSSQTVKAGGQEFQVSWRGDMVVDVQPPSQRDGLYQEPFRRVEGSGEGRGARDEGRGTRGEGRGPAAAASATAPAVLVRSEIQNPYSSIDQVPNAYLLQDAAVSCRANILERLDADLDYKPFFRIYPFADPPYAAHEKWDDADMTGRYVEALILARRMTGGTMELREPKLREYLVSLFDPSDGLAYTQQTEWTPRRACMFSQSCAMLGLIAWHDESGSPAVKLLLDKHVEGLMKLSIRKENYAYFPKYEWDGQQWIDEPVGKDAPAWYGGRNLLPLVEYWQRFPRPDVAEFIERLARYCIEVNPTVKPDGSVTGGEGWWGHLHGTQDMVAGIAEYARLAGKREWVDWAKRVYDWVGRTNTSRFGFMADVAGGHICESCGIASRARLGLTLYRAGAIEDPFGEIDRFVRNQLLENQFKDTSFLKPMQPTTTAPAGGQKCYQDIDRMILGQFQCWATANDLIGHDDIEGCGAGGGMQALHLAWSNVAEWKGEELSVHLLFNRRIGAKHSGPVSASNPLALEIWSHLPYEGRVDLVAHRPVKARVRLPDQSAMENVRLLHREGETSLKPEGQYVPLPALAEGERVSIRFGLQTAQTDERAAGKSYRIRWKGSTVLAQEPRGEKVPLYTKRGEFERREAPLCAPRYP